MTPLDKKLQRKTTTGGHRNRGLVVTLYPEAQGQALVSLRTAGCRDEVLCDLDWLWLQLNKKKAQEGHVARPGAARRRSTINL
jgi:hypothetical protein